MVNSGPSPFYKKRWGPRRLYKNGGDLAGFIKNGGELAGFMKKRLGPHCFRGKSQKWSFPGISGIIHRRSGPLSSNYGQAWDHSHALLANSKASAEREDNTLAVASGSGADVISAPSSSHAACGAERDRRAFSARVREGVGSQGPYILVQVQG